MKGMLQKWANASSSSLNSFVGGSSTSNEVAAPVVVDSVSSKVEGGHKRSDSEMAIIAEMDSRFYEEDFDSVRCVLGQLPGESSDREIERNLQFHDNLMRVIKSQLSSQIFANYAAFVNIMEGIHAVETDLQSSIDLVSGTRFVLSGAKENLVGHTFVAIALHRRRVRLRVVRAKCLAIIQLMASDRKLSEAINALHFERALQILSDWNSLKQSVASIKAAAPLCNTIGDGYKRLEAHLQSSLENMLLVRSSGESPRSASKTLLPRLYRIADAYVALENAIGFSDRLLEAFSKAVDSSIFQAVQNTCLATAGQDEVAPGSFVELYAMIKASEITDCYFKALDSVNLSLYLFFKVRQYLDESLPKQDQTEITIAVLDSLPNARVVLWERIQHRLVQLLLSVRVSAIDNNLQEMESIYTRSSVLMIIGERFSGFPAEVLSGAVTEKCLQYFQSLHVQSMDRLVLTIESETWHRLPLDTGFSLQSIKELRLDQMSQECNQFNADLTFEKFTDGANTMNKPLAVLSPTASAQPSAVQIGTSPIFISSSAVTLLQLFGKHISVMRSLPNIASTVFSSSIDFFHLYFSIVLSTFLIEYPRFLEGHPTFPTSQRRYPRICSTLNAVVNHVREQKFAYGSVKLIPGTPPKLVKPGQLSLDQLDDLFGLAQRLVALESLKHIHSGFIWLQPIIIRLLPDRGVALPAVEQFSSLALLFSDLEEAQCWFLATRIMTETLKPLISLIPTCKWDIVNLKESSNAYVEKILQMFKFFRTRLDKLTASGDINASVVQILVTNCLRITMDSLVDAFGAVKKCSTEGRAAMSLDVSVLQQGLKEVFHVWPLPGAVRIDEFIKAYYLPMEDFLHFVASHTSDFTLEQHIALARISSATSSLKPKELADFVEKVNKTFTDSIAHKTR
uniref:Syndetin C-terminal domain-containing protein n=1 Tax=Spongospora subterranea TaxID=70186 RepID=A0A0H5QHP5_9EUKA|eukprot:CRZ01177.1 hypothetical protein [Spongospora subterranea]